MFSQDAAVFLADMGSSVSWTPSAGGATVTGKMIFDRPADMLDGGETLSNQYQVTLQASAWPGLKRGELLTIGGDGGGAQYKLRTDPRSDDDGLFSLATLSRV